MPDNSKSILSRPLSPEERQWLRDLGKHPGFLLYLTGVKELQDSCLQALLHTDDTPNTFRQQGRYLGLDKAIDLAGDLLRKGRNTTP